MRTKNNQGELFSNLEYSNSSNKSIRNISITAEDLKEWQDNINNYQSQLFKQSKFMPKQITMLSNANEEKIDRFNPLKLEPLPINFWRFNNCPHSGPAIYLVMDHLKELNSNIILYIGETIEAERRWKGEHDCKSYLSCYREALSIAKLKNQISIRFWSDVPKDTVARRRLEQLLIRKWLPPFNKETRTRWSTPFTSEIT